MNDCWPFAAIEYRHAAPQIKGAFLYETARMFSDHPAFWTNEDRLLFIAADDRRKLAKFPIGDPQVKSLAGAAGTSRRLLYQLLIDHIHAYRVDTYSPLC